jgi:hypothetical protein
MIKSVHIYIIQYARHDYIFQWNWQLKHAPITCTIAWKEVKEGGGRKQGNIEHTVVPNVACGTLVSRECELFCLMYLHAKNQVLMNINS